MNELKIIEWNIHGAASMGWNNKYEIKKFVVDRIISEKAQIVILNEFVISIGWDYFQSELTKNEYIWFIAHTSSQNGILIAINTNIEGLSIEKIKKYEGNNITSIVNDHIKEQPNFLQVKLEINNQSVYIIGIRIRDDESYKNKMKQFEEILKQLKTIGKDEVVMISGDFNHGAIKYESDENYNYEDNSRKDYNYQMMRKLFKDLNLDSHTPDYGSYGRKFSWVMKFQNIKVKEDHIITKKVKVTSIDYLWDFITSENGYGNLKPEDYKSNLIGLPDHAILTATIEI